MGVVPHNAHIDISVIISTHHFGLHTHTHIFSSKNCHPYSIEKYVVINPAIA